MSVPIRKWVCVLISHISTVNSLQGLRLWWPLLSGFIIRQQGAFLTKEWLSFRGGEAEPWLLNLLFSLPVCGRRSLTILMRSEFVPVNPNTAETSLRSRSSLPSFRMALVCRLLLCRKCLFPSRMSTCFWCGIFCFNPNQLKNKSTEQVPGIPFSEPNGLWNASLIWWKWNLLKKKLFTIRKPYLFLYNELYHFISISPLLKNVIS